MQRPSVANLTTSDGSLLRRRLYHPTSLSMAKWVMLLSLMASCCLSAVLFYPNTEQTMTTFSSLQYDRLAHLVAAKPHIKQHAVVSSMDASTSNAHLCPAAANAAGIKARPDREGPWRLSKRMPVLGLNHASDYRQKKIEQTYQVDRHFLESKKLSEQSKSLLRYAKPIDAANKKIESVKEKMKGKVLSLPGATTVKAMQAVSRSDKEKKDALKSSGTAKEKRGLLSPKRTSPEKRSFDRFSKKFDKHYDREERIRDQHGRESVRLHQEAAREGGILSGGARKRSKAVEHRLAMESNDFARVPKSAFLAARDTFFGGNSEGRQRRDTSGANRVDKLVRRCAKAASDGYAQLSRRSEEKSFTNRFDRSVARSNTQVVHHLRQKNSNDVAAIEHGIEGRTRESLSHSRRAFDHNVAAYTTSLATPQRAALSAVGGTVSDAYRSMRGQREESSGQSKRRNDVDDHVILVRRAAPKFGRSSSVGAISHSISSIASHSKAPAAKAGGGVVAAAGRGRTVARGRTATRSPSPSVSRSPSRSPSPAQNGRGGGGHRGMTKGTKVGVASTMAAVAAAAVSNIQIAPPPVTVVVGGKNGGKRVNMQTHLGSGEVNGDVKLGKMGSFNFNRESQPKSFGGGGQEAQ